MRVSTVVVAAAAVAVVVASLLPAASAATMQPVVSGARRGLRATPAPTVELSSSPSPPEAAKQYTAALQITLPYRNVTESMTTSYDEEHSRQRIEYFGGMDTHIIVGKTSYTMVPVVTQLDCFLTGDMGMSSVFPDFSKFKYAGQETVAGQNCQKWQQVVTNGAKVNTYNFYVNEKEQPVQYHWLGFDIMFGSHYDEYVIDYISYIPGDSLFNTTTFEPPAHMTCEGPESASTLGAGVADPLGNLRHMFHPGSDSAPPPDTAVAAEFEAFMAAYDVTYNSEHDRAVGMANYIRNRGLVHVLNRRRTTPSSAVFALNHMADWSADDFARIRGAKTDRPDNNGATGLHTPPTAAEAAQLPTNVDWRQKGAVRPVLDQGICGSCWSFGATGTIAGSHYLKYGKMVLFAQQELIDCSWAFGNNGCGGGNDFMGYQWIMQNGGLASLEAYGPYLMENGWCQTKEAIAERRAKGVKAVGSDPDHADPGVATTITGYMNVTSGSEPALMDALATHGPISISIDAALLSFSFYSSGVYYEPNCGSAPADLDHTVLAIGYGTENGEDYWLVQNSWSDHWGDNGYIKISRKNNCCGVATVPTYVTM